MGKVNYAVRRAESPYTVRPAKNRIRRKGVQMRRRKGETDALPKRFTTAYRFPVMRQESRMTPGQVFPFLRVHKPECTPQAGGNAKIWVEASRMLPFLII